MLLVHKTRKYFTIKFQRSPFSVRKLIKTFMFILKSPLKFKFIFLITRVLKIFTFLLIYGLCLWISILRFQLWKCLLYEYWTTCCNVNSVGVTSDTIKSNACRGFGWFTFEMILKTDMFALIYPFKRNITRLVEGIRENRIRKSDV